MPEGLEFIEPSELYNVLNHATRYCALTDPNYLLLLDARLRGDYNESHIITAKKVEMGELPYAAELECKRHVVVYDGKTRDLEDDSAAVQYGKFLWENGSKNEVKILKGGYEDFSAWYPFLRTKQIIIMPREVDELDMYPSEIIQGLLYLGDRRQADNEQMQKDLKFSGHVNCTTELGETFTEEGESLFHIPVEDHDDADIYSKFESACSFIDKHKSQQQTVLVFSDQGISRSAALCIAYVMHHNKCSLEEAYEHVKKCRPISRPIRAFIRQLSKWEEQLHGQSVTNIEDPNL